MKTSLKHTLYRVAELSLFLMVTAVVATHW